MKITRREAVKAIGAAALVPSLAVANESRLEHLENEKQKAESELRKSQNIFVTAKLGSEVQTREIDLTGTPNEIYDSIQKVLWWPDGNSQGVFERINIPKYVTYSYSEVPRRYIDYNWAGCFNLKADDIVDTTELTEVAVFLENDLFLRFNRFWMDIYSIEKKEVLIGGSVSFPTGYYGYKHLGQHKCDDSVSCVEYYGKFICPASCYLTHYKTRAGDIYWSHPPELPPDLIESGFELMSTRYQPGQICAK